MAYSAPKLLLLGSVVLVWAGVSAGAGTGALASAPTAATRAHCLVDQLRQSPNRKFSPDLVESQLDDLPYLNHVLQQVLADPQIDAGLKKVLVRAVQHPELDLRDLSASVANEIRMDPDNRGLGRNSAPVPTFIKPGFVASLNDRMSDELDNEALDRLSKKRFLILAADRDNVPGASSILTLVHELAHIRFAIFLDQNIAVLARRFPTLIRKAADGSFEMNEQLENFLDERFAHETEYAALEQMRENYLREFPNARWPYARLGANRIAYISNRVIQRYEITDPEVLALAQLPLSRILLQGTRGAKSPGR